MCGIAGILSEQDRTPDLLALRDTMLHRGPDGAGIFSHTSHSTGHWMGLGHRRLAIRDRSASGHQPMSDPSGRFTMVYNGELYNDQELRHDLRAAQAPPCQGSSDTEAVLLAWSQWGPSSVERFQGEFAFAIWDSKLEELWLCRDRLGIKPLFYAEVSGDFAFASELSALHKQGLTSNEVDPEAIDGFLAFGSVPEPRTILKGVTLLRAGHLLRLSPRTDSQGEPYKKSLLPYWENPFLKRQANEPSQDEIEWLIEDAIRSRLVSDVPLGTFLSGGVDSSCVTNIAARHSGHQLVSICVDTGSGSGPDTEQAQAIATALRTKHVQVNLSEQYLLEHLSPALDAQDQPSMDGINTYFASQAAKEAGLTVALSGIGADELFAGYNTASRVRFLPVLQHASPFLAILGCMGRPRTRAHAKVFAFSKSDRSPQAFYGISRALFLANERAALHKNQVRSESQWVREQAPWANSVADPTNLMCSLEVYTYLRNTLLRDTDCVSMRHSLEVRGPFLDHRLVELAARIGGRRKLSRRTNKPLLMRTHGRILPASYQPRPKQGFTLPWGRWMKEGLVPVANAFSPKQDSRWEALGLGPEAVRLLWERFTRGDGPVQPAHIWSLFALAAWHRRVFG